MNDTLRITGVLRYALPIAALVVLALTFGRNMLGASADMEWKRPALPACEANEELFPRKVAIPEGQTLIDIWAKIYHDNVRRIIDDHLRQLKIGGNCDASTRTAPTDALAKLGEDLAWDNISEEDLPAVLLRYLETYECAIQSESFVVEPQAEYILSLRQKEKGETQAISIVNFQNEVEHERRRIRQEMQTARRTMHHMLVYLSGYGRFQPLNSALQCFVGASVDIRNNLDLAAEASACMPRIWDAKTSLRTLPSQ